MPPKSSASVARPPRRTTRATVRKSIPQSSAQKSTTIKSQSPAPDNNDSSETPSPSATTTAATTPPKSSPLTSPKKEKTNPDLTPNTASAVTTPKTFPLTSPLKRNTTIRNSTPGADSLASSENPSENEVVGEDQATQAMASASKADSVAVSAQIYPSADAEATGELGPEEARAETLLTAETAAIEAAGTENGRGTSNEGGARTGTKTMVKKTVRVVKKVVKRRVPKRVPKGQDVSANAEAGEKQEAAGEKQGAAVDKPEAVVERDRSDSAVSAEVDVGNSDPILSVSMEVEKPNFDGIVSMEVGNLNSNLTILEKGENVDSKLSGVDSMEIEKPSLDVDAAGNVENLKESEICEREKDASSYEILSKALVMDFDGAMNNGVEGEKTVTLGKSQLEDQNVGFVEEKTVEMVEDQNVASIDGQNMEAVLDQNMELMGDQSDAPKPENVDSRRGEFEEEVRDGLENGQVGSSKVEVGLGDGILLSGEMEALERRKRRRTELFVGGLDKDAKEEDVRKVFEEVGEVTEVRLMMNAKTGKNKGFAFVRYASAVDAKNALAKYQEVEICGKQCGTSPVEGNDTIFLGNIDKKWNSEDVVKLLQQVGIDKIDKVTVMADPNNIEFNRGFAFLELETSKDAQIAFNKLKKMDVFGKHKVKVAWAEPLIEPDENEVLKVKSVYAEYLPSSWDEEKVKDYFSKFGEVKNVALARNLRSSRRKDFAFVNYTTREAALACIEAFSRGQLNDECSKVNVKVSLAKPMPKAKKAKHVSSPIIKELSKEKQKSALPVLRPHELRNKGISISTNSGDIRVDRRSSTTAELVQLLREQATWKQAQITSGSGSVDPDYSYSSPGMKRPFSIFGGGPVYSDPRGYPRARYESSYPISNPSAPLFQGVGKISSAHTNQQASFYGVEDYSSHLQTRERSSCHGSSGVIYRRY